MAVVNFERNASVSEMAAEIDRRGAVIERLEAAAAKSEALLRDTLKLLSRCHDRVHALPRTSDTDLAASIDKMLGKIRAISAPVPSPAQPAALDKIKLWFFRDLQSDQRLSLFRLFGMPVEEIRSHGDEGHCFKRVFATAPDTSEGLCDGSRALPCDRETLGWMVREAWVRWAQAQPAPKSSWLVPYDDLPEADKEADRQIGETIARWTLVHDAARASFAPDTSEGLVRALEEIASTHGTADMLRSKARAALIAQLGRPEYLIEAEQRIGAQDYRRTRQIERALKRKRESPNWTPPEAA